MKINLTFLSCLLIALRCKQADTETLWKQCHLLGAYHYMAWLHQDTKGERSHMCFSLTQLLNTSEGQTKSRREGQCFGRGPTFKFLIALLCKAGIRPHTPRSCTREGVSLWLVMATTLKMPEVHIKL